MLSSRTVLAAWLLGLAVLMCGFVLTEAGAFDGKGLPKGVAARPGFVTAALTPRRPSFIGGRPGHLARLVGRKLMSSVTQVWLYADNNSCDAANLEATLQAHVTQLNPQVGPMAYKGQVTSAQLQDKTFVQQIDLLVAYNCDNYNPLWDTDTINNVTAALKKNVIWQVIIWTRETSGQGDYPLLPIGAVTYTPTYGDLAALSTATDITNNPDTGLTPNITALDNLGAATYAGYISLATFNALPKSGGGRYKYLVSAANNNNINTFAYTVGTNNPLNVFYSTYPMDYNVIGYAGPDIQTISAQIQLNAIATMMAQQ